MKTIELTQGKVALVDDEDFEELNQFKWCAVKNRNTFYAMTCVNYANIRMHRKIMNAPKDMQVDHIDGNGLNNCRSNLRIVTARQNSQNKHTKKTSIFPGVCWFRRDQKWRANIMINGTRKHLGLFDLETDAYEAYIKVLSAIDEICVDNIAT